MRDLKINGDRLSYKNGDFETVEGVERVKQHLKTGLKILPGDWILDYRKGIPYFSAMKAYPDILRGKIKNAIAEVYGVDNIIKYDFEQLDDSYMVKAAVRSGSEEILIEEAINAI